ncbi:MAG: DUF4296 domain-containing protein [Rikenellaceae bacterium]
MKRVLTYITLGVILLSCKSQTIIPDRELAQIFHEVFLANAYTQTRPFGQDTMRLYEPIFEKYGYTQDDIHYTIGNFSKRKSARLSDVVERAIASLEKEGLEYDREANILTIVDRAAQDRLKITRLEQGRLLFDELDKLDELSFSVENIDIGSYSIDFDYLIDSLDQTRGSYVTKIWFENDSDTLKREIKAKSTNLSRRRVAHYSTNIDVEEPYDRLRIDVATPRSFDERVHVQIKDLKVLYTPTVDNAATILFNMLVDPKLFSDELLPISEKDSL